MHGFEQKVREALDKEKLAHAERQDVERGAMEQVPLDGIVAAGIQELEEEMTDNVQNPDPAIDAVVTCIQGEQDDGAAMETAGIRVPTAPVKLRGSKAWTTTFEDLFSERIVSMRKHDVTVIALESAATGAAVVTIIATLILRHS